MGTDSGASAVELTLLTPALLFVVFVIVQAALYMHARHVVLAAAQQGARIARTAPATDPAETSSAVTQTRTATLAYLDQLGGRVLTDAHVTVNSTATAATVTITARAVSIVPGLHLTISETSTGPRETFIGATAP